MTCGILSLLCGDVIWNGNNCGARIRGMESSK